jgi:hypothetical protein
VSAETNMASGTGGHRDSQRALRVRRRGRLTASPCAAMPKLLNIIGGTLFFIAFLNFTVFWIVAVSIGGDAISGRVEGGRYYLSNHGKLTEVSPRVWHYSRVHTISIWITHPLGIFGGGGLMALSRRMGKAA